MAHQDYSPKPKSKAAHLTFPSSSRTSPSSLTSPACAGAKYRASDGQMFTVMQSRCMNSKSREDWTIVFESELSELMERRKEAPKVKTKKASS